MGRHYKITPKELEKFYQHVDELCEDIFTAKVDETRDSTKESSKAKIE